MRLLFTIILLLGLSACGLLQRHENSGYGGFSDSGIDPIADYYEDKTRYEMSMAKEEIGLETTSALDPRDRQRLDNRLTLNRLEDKLASERERRQYYYYKPLMASDAERIEFLMIPSIEGRERWAQGHQINQKKMTHNDFEKVYIEKSDVAEGMSKDAVRESWGEPDLVEVAGDPLYGNERWRYTKMISSNSGYSKQVRVIYFESGRVAGWETY